MKGYLLHSQVHHAQVVEDLPVEGREVVGSLEAGDAGNELLLAEEAHPDVVPQLRRFRQLSIGGVAVLCLVTFICS
jgi:hypothetical protein